MTAKRMEDFLDSVAESFTQEVAAIEARRIAVQNALRDILPAVQEQTKELERRDKMLKQVESQLAMGKMELYKAEKELSELRKELFRTQASLQSVCGEYEERIRVMERMHEAELRYMREERERAEARFRIAAIHVPGPGMPAIIMSDPEEPQVKSNPQIGLEPHESAIRIEGERIYCIDKTAFGPDRAELAEPKLIRLDASVFMQQNNFPNPLQPESSNVIHGSAGSHENGKLPLSIRKPREQVLFEEENPRLHSLGFISMTVDLLTWGRKLLELRRLEYHKSLSDIADQLYIPFYEMKSPWSRFLSARISIKCVPAWAVSAQEHMADPQSAPFHPAGCHRVVLQRLNLDRSGTSPKPVFATQNIIVRAGSEMPVIDWGLSEQDNNLIALVHLNAANELPIHVELRTVFDMPGAPAGKLHPQAKWRIIPIPVAAVDPSMLAVDKVATCCRLTEDVLAISVHFNEPVAPELCLIQLYAWRKGTRIVEPITTGAVEFTFTSNSSLLALGNDLDRLEISQIPSVSDELLAEEKLPTTRKCALSLPRLRSTHRINAATFHCEGQRAPTNPERSVDWAPRDFFIPNCETSCILVSYDTIDLQTGACSGKHVFIIQRTPFEQIVEEALRRGPDTEVPWDEWGPTCTRYIDGTEVRCISGASLNGQCVLGLRKPLEGPKHRMCILDFNQKKVAEFKRKHESEEEQAVGPQTVIRRRIAAGSCCSRQLSDSPFASDIVSEVPFIESRTTDVFDLDAVYMDGQFMTGVKWASDVTDASGVVTTRPGHLVVRSYG
ncbi:hypothetical protein MKEN_00456400 [Mycena kentingensis (nom. inval.)]|nr:hypothetical protein MKEN_00456400 [Mycena kentingensis (nom. inval.)]